MNLIKALAIRFFFFFLAFGNVDDHDENRSDADVKNILWIHNNLCK